MTPLKKDKNDPALTSMSRVELGDLMANEWCKRARTACKYEESDDENGYEKPVPM